MIQEENAISATTISNEMSSTNHVTVFSVGFNIQTGETKLVSSGIINKEGIKQIIKLLSTYGEDEYKKIPIPKAN